MSTLTGLVVAIPLSVGLTACVALLPAAVVPQLAATVGVAGIAAASCASDTCEQQVSQCGSPTDKRLEVVESGDVGIPADEGAVRSFSPAYWQSQFVPQGAAPAARAAQPAAGTLAVTDRSIVFAPPRGGEGLRLPLAGVVAVALQQDPTTGSPRQLTVESCFGRLDRFAFGEAKMPRQADPKATADAAADIKARMAARAAVRDQRTP